MYSNKYWAISVNSEMGTPRETMEVKSHCPRRAYGLKLEREYNIRKSARHPYGMKTYAELSGKEPKELKDKKPSRQHIDSSVYYAVGFGKDGIELAFGDFYNPLLKPEDIIMKTPECLIGAEKLTGTNARDNQIYSYSRFGGVITRTYGVLEVLTYVSA